MRLASMLALALMPVVSACGVNPLNLSSLPVSSSVAVRSEATHNWLRTAGSEPVASLGLKVPVRDALVDGEVVGLTVSGCGIRASAFTLRILEELEELQPILPIAQIVPAPRSHTRRRQSLAGLPRPLMWMFDAGPMA